MQGRVHPGDAARHWLGVTFGTAPGRQARFRPAYIGMDSGDGELGIAGWNRAGANYAGLVAPERDHSSDTRE
jgi:hypothetical protein